VQTILLFILFFVFLLLNLPIALALGCSSLFVILFFSDLPLQLIAQRFFATLDSFPIMAIPLFMLAGQLMNSSGITKRIVTFSDTMVGHIRGGLAQTNILASILFSGISGSAAADTSVMGAMLIPAMKKKGYDTDFAVVVTCTSSCIGPIIPPSILFIIYASITGLSVAELFIAGIIPGLLVGVGLLILTYIISVSRNYPKDDPTSFAQKRQAFINTIDALIMPFIIIGGVISGVFTATESGAVAVVYAIIVGLIRKELNIVKLVNSFYDAAVMTGVTMIIIAAASLFSWLLTVNMFPHQVASLLQSISSNKLVITFLLVMLFLVVGLFLDGTSAILILVPVLSPLTVQYGFDPIHLAMFMVVTLLIGGITPPVGILLFIATAIGKIKVKETIPILIPYFITMVIIALIIAYIPAITTFLPSVIMK
jgi:tripartite ATP-independent transporter DctM subunit